MASYTYTGLSLGTDYSKISIEHFLFLANSGLNLNLRAFIFFAELLLYYCANLRFS